jgi:hypothetical protein
MLSYLLPYLCTQHTCTEHPPRPCVCGCALSHCPLPCRLDCFTKDLRAAIGRDNNLGWADPPYRPREQTIPRAVISHALGDGTRCGARSSLRVGGANAAWELVAGDHAAGGVLMPERGTCRTRRTVQKAAHTHTHPPSTHAPCGVCSTP